MKTINKNHRSFQTVPNFQNIYSKKPKMHLRLTASERLKLCSTESLKGKFRIK